MLYTLPGITPRAKSRDSFTSCSRFSTSPDLSTLPWLRLTASLSPQAQPLVLTVQQQDHPSVSECRKGGFDALFFIF